MYLVRCYIELGLRNYPWLSLLCWHYGYGELWLISRWGVGSGWLTVFLLILQNDKGESVVDKHSFHKILDDPEAHFKYTKAGVIVIGERDQIQIPLSVGLKGQILGGEKKLYCC